MDEQTIIEGGCHCGNIQYHYITGVPLEKLSVRACSCSFCTKQGAIYTSDPKGKLNVKIKSNDDIKKYQFSTKHIDFLFCAICGVMPLSVTEIDGKLYALINIRTSNKNLLNLPVQTIDFSGESVEDSIRRRKSKWIPTVTGI